jgi:quercetin dioxygenase-like cupin family protein
MKKIFVTLGMTALVAVAGSIVVAQSQEESPEKDDLIFSSAEKATFEEVSPGVSKAAVWGNEEQGAYGAFTKFKPGQGNGMHTHTNDICVVGIKGAHIYRDEAGEKRVTAGNFIRIPGGKKHWSGGDKKTGASFYEESSGKFDLVPVK